MANLGLLENTISNGKLEEALSIVKDAISDGNSPEIIINKHMVKGMEDVGRRYEEGKAFVPHLLLAARAMRGCLDYLAPYMKDQCVRTLGTAVIGTVQGDLHDIGKNLTASLLEGCGFKVINLGVDVSADQFVAAAREHDAQIVGLSALLTTTMNYMKDIVEAFKFAGLRDKVKIIVGGAPLSQEFAESIGADGYSENAHGAVVLAKSLIALDSRD